jgi:piezo-type mechanosensitive ion channel component 1/2
MENWFIPTIRLPALIRPKLIKAFNLKQNIYISRNCSINTATGITSFWWEVSQNVWAADDKTRGQSNGLVFFTWSEKVTSQLIAYSLVTFYIVVVLGIGRAIRSIIQTGSEQIFIKDMPKPDSLILICEGVLISRLENNLEREEQLYYVLIDIMRSPEILKMITTSSLRKKND